jgi:hypothetical protein
MRQDHDERGWFTKGNRGRPAGSPNKWRPPGTRKRRYNDQGRPLDAREVDAMQRLRNLIDEFIDDLGGEEDLTNGGRHWARRCALIVLACEDMEKKAILGGIEQINLGTYATLFSHLTKALNMLGVRRGPQVTTLQAHFASKAREQQQRLSEARDLVVVEVEEIDEDLADGSQ